MEDWLVFFGTFYKFELPSNLQDGFCKIDSLILLVFSDCKYKPGVFRPDIYQYWGLNVHLSTSLSIKQYFCHKANNYVKYYLVAASKFVYFLEIRKLLFGGLIDKAEGVYRIDILKSLLQGVLGLFWCSTFIIGWCWLVMSFDKMLIDLLMARLYFSSYVSRTKWGFTAGAPLSWTLF